ncbi:DUF4340 domain-containing protein [Salidesulfovibrio brasiliensis]
MKRIGLTLTILILAVAALIVAGGYHFLVSVDRAGGVDNWLSVESADVTAVVIDGPHGVFRIERDGDGWNAVRGNVRTRADITRVKSLLDALNNSRSVSADSEPVAGKLGFGLDDPSAKLTLILEGDGRIQFRFGSLDTAMERVYFWTNVRGGGIYQADAASLRFLDKPLSYFEDLRLLPHMSLDDVKSVQLVMRYGAGWKLVREGEEFVFELPGYLKGKPASLPEVRLYVESLSQIRAGRLLPGESVPDRHPHLTVLVEAEKGDPERLDLYRGIGSAPFLGMSSWQPVSFDLDRTVVSQIVRTPFDMQGRRVVDLEIGKIHSVALTFDNVTRVAQRTEKGWSEPAGENDVMGIDMSLWRLNEMKFEAMPLERISGELRESMICVLRDENGEPLASLYFYQDPSLPEGQIWLRNGGGLYYPVPSQIVEDLRGLFPARGTASGRPDA